MPEKSRKITDISAEMIKKFVGQHVFHLEQQVLSMMNLKMEKSDNSLSDTVPMYLLDQYANLTFAAYMAFRDGVLGRNGLIKDITLYHFAREYTRLHWLIVETTVWTRKPKMLREYTSAQLKYQVDKKLILPNPETASIEVIKANFEELREAHAEFSSAVQGINKKIETEAFRFLGIITKRFFDLYKRCESPLEQAFLIGMMAYGETRSVSWINMADPNIFDCQVPVEQYRLDFAARKFEGKDLVLQLDIEVDGHTYHERTPEQAVHDRQRDRFLQEQGWRVIRFHRQEIEDDLQRCIGDFARAYAQDPRRPPSISL